MRASSERKNRWAAVLVIVLAVAGFSIAGVVGVVLPAGSNAVATNAPAAASAPTDLSGGPLVPLVGSTGFNPGQLPTQIGAYSIASDPSAMTATSTMTVTVSLNPTGDLATYANEVANPNSPYYHQYLTPQGIASQFGVSPANYAGLVSYFSGFGLSVTPSATSLGLMVSGSPAQIGAAFHSTVQAFSMQYKSGGLWNPLFGNDSAANNSVSSRVFYAATGVSYLPAGVNALVSGVSGLSGGMATPNVAMPLGLDPANLMTNLVNTTASGFTPLTSIQGIAGANYTWTPGSNSFLCYFYGVGCSPSQFLFPSTMHVLTGAQNLWSGASTIDSQPDQGQGVTIAVVEVGCAIPSDLASWSAQTFGSSSQLMNRLTQIAINDPTAYFPNTNLNNCVFNGYMWGWTIETMLDIEYAAAMAPLAHIDVIGLPSAYFSSIDNAYLDIAQYLSTGSSCALSGSPAIIVAGPSQDACSVTITSNSYGSGEAYTAYVGSPMYLTVEDQNLHILNLVGVTNFFASGDYSGAVFGAATNSGIPAVAEGSTSVGGGQLTAAGPGGQEFPVTSTQTCMGFVWFGYCFGQLAYVAPAASIGSFTYWDYGFGIGGTYQGLIGGGFGQSLSEQQPWWQNALDTYSSGQKMDPVISGSAAFNMTIYAFGTWYFEYGGTSFATPIAAGEWALIEEQALTAFNTAKMGDINPLLYAAHNAYEAGVSSASADPYVPMQDTGFGFDWGPISSFTWYFYNLSINSELGGVSSPPIPQWFPTLYNPAGNGWNYLQGLGMPLATTLDNELIGQVPSVQHALDDEPFSVLEVTSSGGLVPFTTLVGGTTYTLQVVLANGQPGGYYTVQAYSGGTGVNVYGGGTVTTISTGSNGQFTYTPVYAAPPLEPTNATEYGYFLVTSVAGGASPDWSFLAFAVGQPSATGTLSLCVTDAYGVCQTAVAEQTMFATVPYTGFYQLGAPAYATLNGLPVAGAMLWQVAVVSDYGFLDPTLAPGYYAPGATIGHFLTDTRGSAEYWVDGFLAENNGPVYTQVYILTATYDGLVSNSVTVFVEPQTGSMNMSQLSFDQSSGTVSGTLSFSDLKYVDFVNISVGSAPGQYINYTAPLPGAFLGGPPTYYDWAQPPNTVPFPGEMPYFDSNPSVSYSPAPGVWLPGIWLNAISDGQLPVSISTLGLDGPVVVSVVAGGTNDVSFSFSFFGYTFVFPLVQYPIFWQDPIVFLPATLTASQATSSVTGSDTFTWSGTAYPGAVGKLELVSGGTTAVLATGLKGSYTLDTTGLLDGQYSVTFVETAPGATATQPSIGFYADNQAASASALISQLQAELGADAQTITSLQAGWASANTTIASLQSQVASLQASLSAANANIAALQAQVTSMNQEIQSLETGWAGANATVTSLQTQLAADTATVSSLQAQITALQKDNAANATTVATLKGELSSAQIQLSSTQGALAQAKTQLSVDATQIASLQGQVQNLQNQLNAKQGYIAPAWYDTFPGGGLAVGILFAAVGAALGAMGVYALRRRRPRATSGPEMPVRSATSSESQLPSPSLEGTDGPRRSREDVLRRAMAARDRLLREGDVRAANRIGQTAKILGDLAGVPVPPPEFETIYR